MVLPTQLMLACLFTNIPGPPGVKFEDSYIQLLPIDKSKCPQINPDLDITFELYTDKNPIQPQRLKIGDDKLLNKSYLDFSNPTVIFFHAFFEDFYAPTEVSIRTGYFQRGGHNMIFINARRLVAGPWYFTAARNTRVIGQYAAIFIDYLVTKGLDLRSLHLMGLSLGAQMAGVAGFHLRSGRVPRITGLDPARPYFTKVPAKYRLDRSDAEFVDIIHTDAGVFGYESPMGHADFWPNNGRNPQPGCMYEDIDKRNPGSIMESLFCSHWRSYQYYAESVIRGPDAFIAISCKSWQDFTVGRCDVNSSIPMGFLTPSYARGNYYLITNEESPFSIS